MTCSVVRAIILIVNNDIYVTDFYIQNQYFSLKYRWWDRQETVSAVKIDAPERQRILYWLQIIGWLV